MYIFVYSICGQARHVNINDFILNQFNFCLKTFRGILYNVSEWCGDSLVCVPVQATPPQPDTTHALIHALQH